MDAEQARKVVNGSAYLLQIGVAHRVRQMQAGWEVVATQHPWQRGDQARFIDVILASGPVIRLVVECKRPGGGEYTFLVPHDAAWEAKLRGSRGRSNAGARARARRRSRTTPTPRSGSALAHADELELYPSDDAILAMWRGVPTALVLIGATRHRWVVL